MTLELHKEIAEKIREAHGLMAEIRDICWEEFAKTNKINTTISRIMEKNIPALKNQLDDDYVQITTPEDRDMLGFIYYGDQ